MKGPIPREAGASVNTSLAVNWLDLVLAHAKVVTIQSTTPASSTAASTAPPTNPGATAAASIGPTSIGPTSTAPPSVASRSIAPAAPSGTESASRLNAEWRQRLLTAVAAPVGGLPLRQTVYPGDRVAVVFGRGVSGVEPIALALLDLLREQGVRQEDIVIVGDPTAKASAAAVLAGSPIQWVEHLASDSGSVALVGVSRDDHPIYVNRHLAEADVVIPVVRLCPDVAETLAGSIYPWLSTVETQDRLSGFDRQQQDESIEAEKLVCPFMMIGVIPAPGDEVGEMLAGLRESIQALASQRIHQLWTTQPANFAAVIATVDGGSSQGSWARLQRGLMNAARLADARGPIVLIAEAAKLEAAVREVVEDGSQSPPGELVDWSAGGEAGRSQVPLDLGSDRRQLMACLEDLTRDRPVYLISRLDVDATEALGFGFLSEPHELSRLLDRGDRVALLRDADRWEIQ